MSTYTANLRGTDFRPIEAQAVVLALEEGQELLLEREPENRFDQNAIRVVDPASGLHLGYVAREVAELISPEMDEGAEIKCLCELPAGKATIIFIETSPIGQSGSA